MINNSNREVQIRNLEQRVVLNPSDKNAVRMLINCLAYYLPSEQEFGVHADYSRLACSLNQETSWRNELMNSANLAQYYKHWLSLLNSMDVHPNIAIQQLTIGQFIKIHGEASICTKRMALFEKEEVISRFCNDCYKVQILPKDMASMLQIYFVLLGLELPRDNARKCMIELREDIQNPYKGYIYCESEDEAIMCVEILQHALNAINLSSTCIGISHGCSEYSIKYPDFKYSSDGAHRSFKRPASWDKIESEFISDKPKPQAKIADFNKQGLTLQDVVGFRTWIHYAEIIGDESCRIFLDKPSSMIPEPFSTVVGKQAQRRKTELDELQERFYSNA